MGWPDVPELPHELCKCLYLHLKIIFAIFLCDVMYKTCSKLKLQLHDIGRVFVFIPPICSLQFHSRFYVI